MYVLTLAACALVAYLAGSIPFGLLLGKLKGIDIREHGSGNIGATNLTRAAGRAWGTTAFALDFLKGLLPAIGAMAVSQRLHGEAPAPVHAGIAAGAAAIAGHVFPVYLRFRGGKGVATTFGVMAGLLPLAALISAGAWLLLFLVTRIVSVASIGAAVLFPISTYLLERSEPAGILGALEGVAIAAAVLILFRHRANIRRLIAGKEHRFR